MSKHTPGPWFASLDIPMNDDTFAITTGEDVTGDWTASVRPLADDDTLELRAEEYAANARLMAAAPDLYDALVALDAALDFGDPIRDDEVIDVEDVSSLNRAMLSARAAIAKARGD